MAKELGRRKAEHYLNHTNATLVDMVVQLVQNA